MPAFGSPSSRTRHPRRRTVRIIKKRDVSRTAVVSLGIATGAAILVFAAWRIWQSGEEAPMYQRLMRDYEMDWRCEGGHSFRSMGRIDSRLCWICDRPAYPVVQYKCPAHGSYEVAFQFSIDEEGVAKPSRVRVSGGKWLSPEDGLKCTRCRRDLTRDQLDPLDRTESRGS